MFEPYFCNGTFLTDWCVRAWYFVVIAVVLFLLYKLVMPKEKKL